MQHTPKHQCRQMMLTMFVISLYVMTIQVLLKVMCQITEGICQALDASLADKCAAANGAEASSSGHQAAAARLVQQCTEVLGIAPEQLFPGWVQRLEGQVRASYEQRLKAADRKAVMAQVTTQPLFVQVAIWHSCHLLLWQVSMFHTCCCACLHHSTGKPACPVMGGARYWSPAVGL